jgi:hypothetical protein
MNQQNQPNQPNQQIQPKLQRINKDKYVKTGDEIQNKLTADDIELLLEEYEEVNDPTELKVGVHVRYYTLVQNKRSKTYEKVFRMGGNIIKIDPEYRYVVISNGKISWSVQVADTDFYRKMTIQDIKQFYENILDEKDLEIKKYKHSYDKAKGLYKKLQEDNANLNEQIANLKKILKKHGIK